MSKCSKLIGLVMSGIVFVAGVSFADVTSDYNDARQLHISKKYAEAQASYEKFLVDYPSAPIDLRANAQFYIGTALRDQKKFDEEQVAYNKVLQTYPTAYVNILAMTRAYLGNSYRRQGNFAEAQMEYEKIINNYLNASADYHVGAQYYIGICLEKQNKLVDANNAFVNTILLAARLPNVTNIQLMKYFCNINPVLMTTDEYKVALQDIIKATPATEANAEFLGRIKSELEKMK